jgi:hypothetical protein
VGAVGAVGAVGRCVRCVAVGAVRGGRCGGCGAWRWLTLLRARLTLTARVALRVALRVLSQSTAVLPDFNDAKWFRGAVDKVSGGSGDVGKRLEYFLATGNLVSESGLDLQQTAGFTIVAERAHASRHPTRTAARALFVPLVPPPPPPYGICVTCRVGGRERAWHAVGVRGPGVAHMMACDGATDS